MKFKCATLAFTVLCSSVVLASNEGGEVADLLHEKPLPSGAFSKGRQPDPKWLIGPLPRQKTTGLPKNMVALPERYSSSKHPTVIPAQ